MAPTTETTSMVKLINWFSEQADSPLKKLASARIILKTGCTIQSLLENKSTDPKLVEQVKTIIEEMTGLKSPV